MNTVITQALATGLPVIATRHSGLPDQVQDCENGFLVDENDYQGLAERVVYYMNHPELWPGMSRHARARAKMAYDSRTLMTVQIDWYLKAIRK